MLHIPLLRLLVLANNSIKITIVMIEGILNIFMILRRMCSISSQSILPVYHFKKISTYFYFTGLNSVKRFIDCIIMMVFSSHFLPTNMLKVISRFQISNHVCTAGMTGLLSKYFVLSKYC